MAKTEKEKHDDYVGKSLSFPLRRNIQGGFQLSAGDRNVEESIRIILGTKFGERLYRPTFGSRLSELVFEPLNTQTLLRTRIYVEEALTIWEARIEVDDVYTEPDPIVGRIDIIIHYHTKEGYSKGSMVYPFYLQGEKSG
ncbi:MAG: GPW/gp25 family protein [Cyanobacteria bacterium P01_E01_bin.42]